MSVPIDESIDHPALERPIVWPASQEWDSTALLR